MIIEVNRESKWGKISVGPEFNSFFEDGVGAEELTEKSGSCHELMGGHTTIAGNFFSGLDCETDVAETIDFMVVGRIGHFGGGFGTGEINMRQ